MASLRDPERFSEIVERYHTAFIRKAKGILGDEDDAYDVVQETFVRIYSAAKKYRKLEGIAFKSWAYKVLVNQCYTQYQKNKKQLNFNVQADEDFAASIPDQYETDAHDNKLTKDYVLSLVSRLPSMLARVVTLHFIEERPQKEVAEIEGVSNEVVRARIHRAKKELREISMNII